MNRIGLDGDKADECERIIRAYKDSLNLTGIFTHLCVADTDTPECKEFTISQINKFKAIAERIQDRARTHHSAEELPSTALPIQMFRQRPSTESFAHQQQHGMLGRNRLGLELSAPVL